MWLILGYLLVTAVLVVTFGRRGDMLGRVRIYTLGFAVFTVFSILLGVTWLHGTVGCHKPGRFGARPADGSALGYCL